MTTIRTFTNKYRKGNLEAATVILEDIARYGGEGSAMVQWARLFIGESRIASKQQRSVRQRLSGTLWLPGMGDGREAASGAGNDHRPSKAQYQPIG